MQLLLPLYDAAGREWPREVYAEIRAELVERFGGMTAYARAPASGWWQPDAAGDRPPVRDELVIFEVMAETIDADWWSAYRRRLERRLDQTRLVVRAEEIVLL